jgi:hypothetical protein
MDIRTEIEKLNQAEPFIVSHWTDTAAATQYRETLDIQSNPERLEKWLKRQEALADREIRLDSIRLTISDVTDSHDEATPDK